MEYLVIALISAVWAGWIGKRKGSSALIWGMVGAVVPFLGVLLAALYRYETDELRRQCPTCGRIVPLHDAICTRCGTELDFPDVAIEPISSASARPG